MIRLPCDLVYYVRTHALHRELYITAMAYGTWRDTRRQLFPTEENTNQDRSSDRETEEDPRDSDDEEFDRYFDSALEISEEKTGKWLPDHRWNSDNKPDPNLKMEDTVAMSSSYPLSRKWARKQTDSKKDVDLAKILSNIPIFVQCEMQGSINGSRQELEQLIKCGESPLKEQNRSNLPPHTREIVDGIKADNRNDERSLPSDDHLKATSMQHVFEKKKPEFCFHVNCEYTLEMYANTDYLPIQTWFDIQQKEQIQWIRKIRYKYKLKRWIFIPSFRRAQIALLEWPQDDDIVTKESTMRILVVRPSEFEEYVKYCGHKFPVICLPQDEIGAGYPRHWIQKIALRLKLQFIWMIDDSVECFYEYHPEKEPPKPGSYTKYRRRKFGLVFERIEHFVQDADDNEKPIAAMSPRRWNPKSRPKKPFSCKPPQGAVFLNLRALSEKNVNYRPELKTLEDMIFGYECEQNGLKVYRDNRILLQDHNWRNTGASSPSVKSKCRNNSEQQ